MEVSLMQLSRDQFLIYLEESVMALTNNSRWNFLPESLMGVLLGEFLKKKNSSMIHQEGSLMELLVE